MNTDEKLKLYSKEKLIDIIEKISVEYAIKNQQYEFLRHNKIKNEMDLQQRIDKAIEYIEHYLEEDRINCGDIYQSVYGELLDILKGSDSNETK